MSDEKPPEKSAADMWTHAPLPYVARIRVSRGDDEAPLLDEVRFDAYSIFEAMVQASMAGGGAYSPTGLGDSKVTIEHLAPDVPEYLRRLAIAVLHVTK